MHLYICIPLFTQNTVKLQQRRRAAEDGIGQYKQTIIDRYNLSSCSTLLLRPGLELRLQVREKENSINIKYPNIVTKGLAIRLHILSVLDWIDRREPSHRENSIYLMIDGSGAFDYSNIFMVLDKLCTIPSCDAVFGVRPPGDWGIATWRKNIELFEEFLIYEKFGKSTLQNITGYEKLPDSQAGCWGLRLGIIKRLPLTARDYEVEYDLLVSAIENKVRIGFTDQLKMLTRDTSDYGNNLNDKETLERCIYKMNFIAHRLDLRKNDIPRLLEKYLSEISESEDLMLPEAYIKELQHFSFSSNV